MSDRNHKYVAWALAAAYLVMASLGHWFHDHGACHDGACHDGAYTDCECSERVGGEFADAGSEEEGPKRDRDGASICSAPPYGHRALADAGSRPCGGSHRCSKESHASSQRPSDHGCGCRASSSCVSLHDCIACQLLGQLAHAQHEVSQLAIQAGSYEDVAQHVSPNLRFDVAQLHSPRGPPVRGFSG